MHHCILSRIIGFFVANKLIPALGINFLRLVFLYSCISFLLKFFYCCLSTIVSIFLPLLSPALPIPTSHPQSFPPLALSMSPLYMFLDHPSLSFPCYSTLLVPLVTVSLFFISMPPVLCCFCCCCCFVD